jgi:predicted nucleic acid-binding Zn ribbon protein
VFRLGDLLADGVRALLGPHRARQATVLAVWPEVVGEVRARHAKVAGIRGHVLVVTTELPALSHELQLRSAALVESLNRRVGGRAIEKIQIVIRPAGAAGPADGGGNRG